MKKGDCWTCCFAEYFVAEHNEKEKVIDINLSAQHKEQKAIDLHAGSSAVQSGLHAQEDPCLMICMSNEPETCGVNGVSWKVHLRDTPCTYTIPLAPLNRDCG